MNRLINFLRKEYIFSFIRVESDKSFGCPFIDFSKIGIKGSR